jgi:hypothetical protein
MKLCSFQIELRIPDDLDEDQQTQLLAAVDALNLPARVRRSLRNTLDQFLAAHGIVITVKN